MTAELIERLRKGIEYDEGDDGMGVVDEDHATSLMTKAATALEQQARELADAKAEIKLLGEYMDDLTNAKVAQTDELVKAERELAEVRSAIEWALGAGDDFPERQKGQGAYWWRKELAKRARLEWSGVEYVRALPHDAVPISIREG